MHLMNFEKFNESRSEEYLKYLKEDEIAPKMSIKVTNPGGGTNVYVVFEIFDGITDLENRVNAKNEDGESLRQEIKYSEDGEKDYKYMLKHREKYENKKIAYVFLEDDIDGQWCFVVYGKDEHINKAEFCTDDHIFRIPATERWKKSNSLTDLNKKIGIIE